MSKDVSRPFHVTLSAVLQLLDLSLSVEGVFVFHRSLVTLLIHRASLSAQLAFAAPLLALLGLIYAVYRGYNRARITVTVLQSLGFLVVAIRMAFSAYRRAVFLASGAESVWMVIRLSIAVAAILLLYTHASNAWFNRPRACAPRNQSS
jgi:hypothetical protein